MRDHEIQRCKEAITRYFKEIEAEEVSNERLSMRFAYVKDDVYREAVNQLKETDHITFTESKTIKMKEDN